MKQFLQIISRRLANFNWVFIFLVLIALLLILNLVTPDYKKRYYNQRLFYLWNKYTFKVNFEHSIWKYRCKVADDKLAIFSVKHTFKVTKLFNKEIWVTETEVEDYFGEKDILKIAELYDANDNCEQLDEIDTYHSYVALPEPTYIK